MPEHELAIASNSNTSNTIHCIHKSNAFNASYHRKNCLLTRYPIKRGMVPFKHLSRYIHGTRDIHAAVYRSHMDVEP